MSADKCKQTIFRLVGAPQFMQRFGKTLMERACMDRAIIEIWYQHVARTRANADYLAGLYLSHSWHGVVVNGAYILEDPVILCHARCAKADDCL